MKKFFMALVCGVMLLSSSLALAAVDGDKIALGAIYPGMSERVLLDAFGQPKQKSGDEWTYPTFKVEVERGIVEEVSTRSDTITTPNGVRVGLAAEALNSTFGTADVVEANSYSVEYKYYSSDRTKKIEFKVTGGIITEISCEIVD